MKRTTRVSPTTAVVGAPSNGPAVAESTDPVAEATEALEQAAPPASKRGRTAKSDNIIIPKLQLVSLTLKLVGDTPLIVHAWSRKALDMMLNKQMGKASAGKKAKNPVEDFIESLYRFPDGRLGFPASAFKACAVSAANDVDLQMTKVKRSFRVVGDMVEIVAPPHTPKSEHWTECDEQYRKELEEFHKHGVSMRQDTVRLATGVADIRFRGSFPAWSVELHILLNRAVLSVEQFVGLLDCAGFGTGVGEWRSSAPESKSGSFGAFHISGEAQVQDPQA